MFTISGGAINWRSVKQYCIIDSIMEVDHELDEVTRAQVIYTHKEVYINPPRGLGLDTLDYFLLKSLILLFQENYVATLYKCQCSKKEWLSGRSQGGWDLFHQVEFDLGTIQSKVKFWTSDILFCFSSFIMTRYGILRSLEGMHLWFKSIPIVHTCLYLKYLWCLDTFFWSWL